MDINEKIAKEFMDLWAEDFLFYGLEHNESIRVYFLDLVKKARESEPRINCGEHFYDFCMISDDDDDLVSYYGEDYFDRKTKMSLAD